jgi:GNAT superfamily N-acetyltransferase
MIPIGNAAAASFLRQDLLRHLAEVVHLERGVPAYPTRAFADAEAPTVVLLVSDAPWGIIAFCSRHDDDFTADALRYLTGLHASFTLKSVDDGIFHAKRVTDLLGGGVVQCFPSLACTYADIRPTPDGRCRQLAPGDRVLFDDYPQERAPGGGRPPSHAELFDLFVVNGQGEAFGFVNDDGLAGYLCCNRQIDNVWDVASIHVLDGKRNRGIGTQLASAYARRRLALGEVPYYSGPANRASERVAEKAGFSPWQGPLPRTGEHQGIGAEIRTHNEEMEPDRLRRRLISDIIE